MQYQGKTLNIDTTAAITEENTRFNRPRRKTDSAVVSFAEKHEGRERQDVKNNNNRRSVGWALAANDDGAVHLHYYHRPYTSTSSPLTRSSTSNAVVKNPDLAEFQPSRLLEKEKADCAVIKSTGRNTLRPSRISFSASDRLPRDSKQQQQQHHHHHHQSMPSLSPSTSNNTAATATSRADFTEATAIQPPPSSSSLSSSSHLRVPQIRFDFECQTPLREKALTSRADATTSTGESLRVDHSTRPVTNNNSNNNNRNSRLPQRASSSATLSRSASSPHSPDVSASSQLLSSPLTLSKKHRNSLPATPDVRANDSWSPNASKRRKPSIDIKSKMPSPGSYQNARSFGGRKDRPVNGMNGLGPVENGGEPTTEDGAYRSADIFLNIAEDSSRRNSIPRSELRRSRFGLSRRSLQPPSPDQSRNSRQVSPLNYSSPNDPSSAYKTPTTPATAHPLDEQDRSRYFGSSSRSAIGIPRSRLSRASPDTSPVSPEVNIDKLGSSQDPRSYRHSTLSTIHSSRQPSGSDTTERPPLDSQKARQDGTESTLSTTAPSTVWDELDDLKSRIRKLELTGKLPMSSQAAMSTVSAERPRTATTTMTTMSSSPRQRRKASIRSADSENGPTIGQVHPLLQAALDKAKGALGNDVHRTLQTVASDAVALSANLGGSSSSPSGGASVVSGYGFSERQAKRKADSLCRSLTELCLALSDEQLHGQRPASRDANPSPQQPNGTHIEPPSRPITYRRSINHNDAEGMDRQQSVFRGPSRLEARRSSLANPADSEVNANLSPKEVTPAQNRLHRLATTVRSRRLHPDDNTGRESTFNRSVSRAATEISTPDPLRRMPSRDRIFRESPQETPSPEQPQQPQQQQRPSQPRTPVFSSNIPLRRSAFYTPPASSFNVQPGFRRYGFRSGITPSVDKSNDDNADYGSATTQQEPFQSTRIVPPSTKLATSQTPIQLTRARTNSLTSRRFGLKPQRPITICGDGKTLDDSID